MITAALDTHRVNAGAALVILLAFAAAVIVWWVGTIRGDLTQWRRKPKPTPKAAGGRHRTDTPSRRRWAADRADDGPPKLPTATRQQLREAGR